jgi:hypothetical protein
MCLFLCKLAVHVSPAAAAAAAEGIHIDCRFAQSSMETRNLGNLRPGWLCMCQVELLLLQLLLL